MLRLVGVTKRFPGVLANDRISLDVRRGEILGLLGENGAGKTTLMNVVYGLHKPDAGQIFVKGRPAEIRNPAHAVELGIGMVHQHFMLVPDMTVAENVALAPSLVPGLVRAGDVERELQVLGDRFGLAVDPKAHVSALSVGARQRVEILKLLYRGADLLILDEPTSALTPTEWRELAEFLRSLAGEGKSVIFITHKLDELFGLVDRCTVLRDGSVVDTVAIADTDKPQLARLMVGREVTLRAERPIVRRGAPVLRVDGLTVSDEDGRDLVHDVSFEVCEGEVFGIAGVSGNGQNELVDALVGVTPQTSGAIHLGGRQLDRLDARQFTEGGGALIPEDRHAEGVAVSLSVLDNLIVKDFTDPELTRRGILNLQNAERRCERLIGEFEIRTPGTAARLGQLSGGNQQKVVLARELARDPRLLIAFQPTRGLDVGATEFVYRKLNEAKRRGCAVLLISFELDEILSLSDRFAVMSGGRFLETLSAEEASTERVGLLLGGEVAAA